MSASRMIVPCSVSPSLSDFGQAIRLASLCCLLATQFGKRSLPLHEKIGASPAALAAFRRFAKSRPRNEIERPRFCSASVRQRKTG